MDNKTVIAVVLSFLVIVRWQIMFPGEPQKAPLQKPAELLPVLQETVKKDPVPQAETPKPLSETIAADEKEVIVENDRFSAVFTSRGGTIKSWTIKPYKDKAGKDVVLLKKPGVVLIPRGGIPSLKVRGG